MSATEITGEEMFESLTGFEEIAIGQHFGGEVAHLAQTKPTMFLRALVATHLSRAGKAVKDAKDEAMGMTLKACNEYFAADEDEVDPEEPVTDAGEGDSPLA